jgi:protein-S-isoprenylcysteine O-methyltransferase Ste14
VLRPLAEALIGVGFFGVCVLLWRPLPIEPSDLARMGSDVAGAALGMAGLALVLWGRLTLGRLYGVSSTSAARLYADHRLITHGPFAHVRHPMYLGMEMASFGGLFLYRTWTAVFLCVAFLALVIRARREDELLELEFGDKWKAYRKWVPGWLPWKGRIKQDRSSG